MLLAFRLKADLEPHGLGVVLLAHGGLGRLGCGGEQPKSGAVGSGEAVAPPEMPADSMGTVGLAC